MVNRRWSERLFSYLTTVNILLFSLFGTNWEIGYSKEEMVGSAKGEKVIKPSSPTSCINTMHSNSFCTISLSRLSFRCRQHFSSRSFQNSTITSLIPRLDARSLSTCNSLQNSDSQTARKGPRYDLLFCGTDNFALPVLQRLVKEPGQCLGRVRSCPLFFFRSSWTRKEAACWRHPFLNLSHY